MRVISTLRSAVALPGRRLNGALVILTVIIGVVTMHSMSGSPTSHGHGPHGASVTSATSVQSATTAESMSALETRDGHTTPDPAASEGGCCNECGGHDAAMAMCLMVLVALLALAAPVRRLLWRALPAWSTAPALLATALHAVSAPSLRELCISRT